MDIAGFDEQFDPKIAFVQMNLTSELVGNNGCRRGISSFYSGKSKSFTSLGEASSACSIKDIAKQENAYTRRRRNVLAINHVWDKNRGNGKRPITSSRSSLALAVAMSSSESIASTSDDSSSRSPPRLPPLHPRSRGSSWRSYSVADFEQCRNDVNSNSFCSFAGEKIDHKQLIWHL